MSGRWQVGGASTPQLRYRSEGRCGVSRGDPTLPQTGIRAPAAGATSSSDERTRPALPVTLVAAVHGDAPGRDAEGVTTAGLHHLAVGGQHARGPFSSTSSSGTSPLPYTRLARAPRVITRAATAARVPHVRAQVAHVEQAGVERGRRPGTARAGGRAVADEQQPHRAPLAVDPDRRAGAAQHRRPGPRARATCPSAAPASPAAAPCPGSRRGSRC